MSSLTFIDSIGISWGMFGLTDGLLIFLKKFSKAAKAIATIMPRKTKTSGTDMSTSSETATFVLVLVILVVFTIFFEVVVFLASVTCSLVGL